jgi:hypothetical protein
MFSADISGLNIDPTALKLPKFSPEELMGQTFIRTDKNGNHCTARVVRKITENLYILNGFLSFLY